MNVGQAKDIARDWVGMNAPAWPGLRAAHLVGGITAMPEDAPFPTTRDVDFHLIFAAGSPMLQPHGPFPTILATTWRGLPIEAGVKSEADYASAEAVLANPEIAYHLTVESAVYDPEGVLGALYEAVRRDYARRRWVKARVEHERAGFDGALGMMEMARGAYGQSGEANILGYLSTFLVAALQMASLESPKMGGGRMFARFQPLLDRLDRLDLYEELHDVLGTSATTREQAERYLGYAAEAFDLAVQIKRTPHPFEHKMHPHLRPYFIDSCAALIDEGYHREALCWTAACLCAATDVIQADGDEADKVRFGAMQGELLRDVGFDGDDAGARKLRQMLALRDRVFGLASEIIATNPAIND